ncbi:MAG: hypothetical protein MN733_17810, partial [Nitrososphaera sp.]|nr:hypothetical protein [Nitrososphaera sp.]
MRVQLIQSFFVFFLVSIIGADVSAFDVCDEMAYLNKPDLSPYGVVKKTRMIYEGSLWESGEDRDQLPQEQNVIDFVSSNYADYEDILITDIEQWALKTPSDIDAHLDKYVTVMEWIRSAAPHAQHGLYGKPPSPDPSKASLDPSHSTYQAWQDTNDMYGPLTDMLDVLNPQMYTVNTDRAF